VRVGKFNVETVSVKKIVDWLPSVASLHRRTGFFDPFEEILAVCGEF